MLVIRMSYKRLYFPIKNSNEADYIDAGILSMADVLRSNCNS